MKLINALSILAVSACIPMAAQRPSATESQATTQQAATPLAKDAVSCNDKGCPKQDQHGHPPASCAYQYGISTGFRCILLCSYTDSQWGTIVDSSTCH